MSLRPLGALLLLGLCLGCTGEARVLHVDAQTGDDAGLCEIETPCRTLGRAAELLRGGDELVVRPGTYFEHVHFDALDSSASRPVWIHAEPRGAATVSGMWKEAARGEVSWRDEGDGIYSTPSTERLFGSFDGAFLFRFMSLADLKAGRARTDGGLVQLPDDGFACEGGRLFVRLPGRVDPNGRGLLFSPPSWGERKPQPVVRVTDSPGVILDGFRIEGSGTFCARFDAASERAVVRNSVLAWCRYGLRLPDHALVEWVEYTYPGFGDFADRIKEMNEGRLRVFDLVKGYQPAWLEGGLADTYGKDGTSRDVEFRFNFLHETFDGESLGDFEYSSSHHTVYLRNFDDHVELESWAGHGSRELRLHDSLFLSVGLISHQGDAIIGPQYVERNVRYPYDADGEASWTIIKSDAPNAREGIFYRHNVLWGRRGELFWQERAHQALRFENNVIVFERITNRPGEPALQSDGNVLVNDLDLAWLRGSRGLYAGIAPSLLRFVDLAALDFRLRETSIAVGRGLSFEGEGAPAPPWPRPRETTFAEVPPERWLARTR